MTKNHFVFINQYYPPDLAPTGMMLRDVAEELAIRGDKVTVICSKGGYSGDPQTTASMRQSGANLRVLRVPAFTKGRATSLGKIASYGSFYILAALFGLFRGGRPTCFIALTTPPFLSVLVRMVSKLRKASHAHWVMDIYPDVMVAHGIFDKDSWQARTLWTLSRWGFGGQRNQATVSLGPDMVSRLAKRHEVDNGIAIPLWSKDKTQEVTDEMRRLLRLERGWSDKVVFLYSGNMGLGHRLTDFLNLAKANEGREDVLFAFFGGGKRAAEVKSFLLQNPTVAVELGDYVDEKILSAHLQSADVHLASLEPSWDGCMVPSKIQGIFASRRPVIFNGTSTSSIGSWIEKGDCGWVVPPDHCSAVQAAFDEALDARIREAKGSNGCRYAKAKFNSTKNISELCDAFS